MQTDTLPVKRTVSWPAWLALAVVLVLGWALRGTIGFSSDLVPGINGAYYAVQARAVLRTGMLGIPDFPLLFYLQAGLGWLVSLFQGETGIMTATRWTDTILPVLVAVPVFLFAREFANGERRPWRTALAVLLAGIVAVGNDALLRLLGDFQKQAAGLPLSLTFLYFFYRALKHHRRRDAILAAVFFGLACLTHIGVTAMTLVLAGFMVLHSLFQSPNRRRAVWIAIGLGAVLIAALGLVYAIDPTRIERLLGVAFNPADLFANSLLLRWLRQGGQAALRATATEGLLLGNLLGLLGIGVALGFRRTAGPAERGLLWASSLAALLLASPAIGSEWSQRLALMAFVPGLIPLTYLIGRARFGWLGGAALAGFVLAGMIPTLLLPVNFKDRNTLSLDAYQELEAIGAQLPEGDTLVIARHGLEWWAAWTMDTYISNRVQVAADAWDEYDSVYLLEQINPSAFGDGGTATGANPVLINPGQRLPARVPGANQPVNPQPGGQNQPFVPQQGGPNQPVGPQQGGGPGGNEPDLPDGMLTIIYEGEFFRLSRVDTETLLTGNNPVGGQRDPSRLTNPVQPAIAVVSRSDWGARDMNLNARAESGVFDPQTNPGGVLTYPGDLRNWLTTVVVHHTALPPNQGPRQIQDLHMDQRGYADIGYHFIIDLDGKIYEGRPLNIRGAHVAGYNTGTVGVVLIGNMDVRQPTREQFDSLRRLLVFLKDRYGITYLAGHQDFPDQGPEGTECPGANLYPMLPPLAKALGMEYGIQGYVQPPWSNQ